VGTHRQVLAVAAQVVGQGGHRRVACLGRRLQRLGDDGVQVAGIGDDGREFAQLFKQGCHGTGFL
jgi:hypothetical protein